MKLSATDILNIPESHLPLAVLSYHTGKGFWHWANKKITDYEGGKYAHFMWMHRPFHFATQDLLYKETHVREYLKNHRLKFWTANIWQDDKRKKLFQAEIQRRLKTNLYSRLYDFLQIFGYVVGQEWIHLPFREICSDHFSPCARILDPYFDDRTIRIEAHPSPPDIDMWCFLQRPAYKVYGVYGR